MSTPTIDITQAVNTFYEAEPFNLTQSPAEAARLIRKGNQIARMYPALDRLLANPANRVVLEAGCGVGWFANTVAFHYKAQVEAVDLCKAALEFGREVSAALGTADRVTFRHGNLFELPAAGIPAEKRFPIVNSLGVLHHTPDCRGAFERVARHVAPGGHFHLGLYHLHGREPFLAMFDEVRHMRADDPHRPAAESAAFALYRGLYPPSVKDEVMLRSWFRDQVLHPHETQHTVEEVLPWIKAAGLEPRTTSVNEFRPVTDWNAIYETERTFRELSYRKNVVDKQYYPGFFVVLAQRPRTGE